MILWASNVQTGIRNPRTLYIITWLLNSLFNLMNLAIFSIGHSIFRTIIVLKQNVSKYSIGHSVFIIDSVILCEWSYGRPTRNSYNYMKIRFYEIWNVGNMEFPIYIIYIYMTVWTSTRKRVTCLSIDRFSFVYVFGVYRNCFNDFFSWYFNVCQNMMWSFLYITMVISKWLCHSYKLVI